jgi:hypothetical protein
MQEPNEELRERRRDQAQIDKLRRYELAIVDLKRVLEVVLPQIQEAMREVHRAEPVIHRFYDDFTDEVGFLGVPTQNIGLDEIREFIVAARSIAGATDKWSRLNLQRIRRLERMLGQ